MAFDNYPMALDESEHRVFVVTRMPARLLVLIPIQAISYRSFPRWAFATMCSMTKLENEFMRAGATAKLASSKRKRQITIRSRRE
jgi:hypothetical protein